MGGVGKIVHQDLDAHVGKGPPEQARDVAVVLEELLRIIGDALGLIAAAELLIGALVGLVELAANIVLIADEEELPGRTCIPVTQEMMHAEAEILEAERGEVLRRRGIGIEIVFRERLTFQAAAFPDTSDEKSRSQKQRRCDDVLSQSAEPIGSNHARVPRRILARMLSPAEADLHAAEVRPCAPPGLRYVPPVRQAGFKVMVNQVVTVFG